MKIDFSNNGNMKMWHLGNTIDHSNPLKSWEISKALCELVAVAWQSVFPFKNNTPMIILEGIQTKTENLTNMNMTKMRPEK